MNDLEKLSLKKIDILGNVIGKFSTNNKSSVDFLQFGRC